MLDIKFIRENKVPLEKTIKNKNINLDIDKLLAIDSRRVKLIQEVESLRSERNENFKGLKGKPDEATIQKGKELKEKIQKVEEELKEVEGTYEELMKLVPMIPSEDTPIGEDESGNVEVKRWNKKEGQDPDEFEFKIKDHIQLGLDLDLLDLERGVKTAGFRGYYLKNEGALMHFALMQYALEKMRSKGFVPMVPPTLVRGDVLFGSGHFPFDTDNVYVADSLLHTKEDANQENKYLVGTSEPSLLYYHAKETLKESDLPIKLVGYSQCYRSEIGSYGKDTRGIYRIHEFLKVEQVVVCKNSKEEAEKWHKQMLEFAEEFIQELGLPYRVLQICTGDMGAGKYKMYDVETWMPSRGSYGETHSASNLLDWQSRRLDLKIEDENGEKYYPYTLNNTVVASPRILIAIWENYQQSDGSIKVPEVLQKYIGKDTIKR